ncbi:MAG: hypothetical protein SGJ04_06535 [Bacteroidota bacterium]|nr:hypothetical protein [Bacteroidota bacterium]
MHRFKTLLPFLLIGLFVFTYTVIRAWKLDITADEASTVMNYATNTWNEVFTNINQPSANNHILNTILIKIFGLVFGYQTFAVRIPNLLALIVYILASFRIVNLLFVSNSLRLFSFTILVCNPYLLEMFGLARGYGLSIAFMLMSLYYLLQYFSVKQSTTYLGYSFFFLILSVYGNFTTINVWLSYVGVLTLFHLFIYKQKVIKVAAIVLGFTVVLTLICWEPLRINIKHKQFYFGGTNGFSYDTFRELFRFLNYDNFIDANYVVYMPGIFMAILLLSSLVFFNIFKSDIAKVSRLGAISGILFVIYSSICLQFVLLKTPVPLGRTSLFIYPILLLNLFTLCSTLINYFAVNANVTKIIKQFLLIFCIFIIAHDVYAYQLNRSSNWTYNANDREILDRIKVDAKGRNLTPDQYRTSIHWVYGASFHYYNKFYPDYKELECIELNYGPESIHNSSLYFVIVDRDWNGRSNLSQDMTRLDSFGPSRAELYLYKPVWDSIQHLNK